MARELSDEEIMHAVLTKAVEEQNWKLVSDIADVKKSRMVPAAEYLTGNQLAEIFGLEKKTDGEYDFVELINACLRVEEYPAVREMPETQRLRVIATAVALLSHV